jgi:hypothetical protein
MRIVHQNPSSTKISSLSNRSSIQMRIVHQNPSSTKIARLVIGRPYKSIVHQNHSLSNRSSIQIDHRPYKSTIVHTNAHRPPKPVVHQNCSLSNRSSIQTGIVHTNPSSTKIRRPPNPSSTKSIVHQIRRPAIVNQNRNFNLPTTPHPALSDLISTRLHVGKAIFE